jgi:UDP-N-acetylglucosamine 1-carboxyvinyltransferase
LGGTTIEIVGVEQLSGGRHRVIPDRIEAATLLVAAAITRGATTVRGARSEHLTAVLEALQAIGATVERRADAIAVCAPDRPRPLAIEARPYPGIPSDVQAQFMALAALADGTSTIADSVFPERFMHVAELNRLGARIERAGSSAVVHGVAALSGAPVMAGDLRASAALVLAGAAAVGETIVRRVYHLDRGYEQLERKLATLGANIERQRDESPTERGEFAGPIAEKSVP